MKQKKIETEYTPGVSPASKVGERYAKKLKAAKKELKLAKQWSSEEHF